jgi:dTDP-4-dehydrorhamnose reductase
MDEPERERWLVTGGTGQLGLALRRRAPPGVAIIAPGREVLDLADLPPLEAMLEGVSAILNCAAYTAVDRAESEAGLAHAINAAGLDIPIVHVSTDYLFASGRSGPWAENDPIAPVSVYGQTKAAGEEAVRNSGARHAIVRTAWIVSADGQNFIKTMLRLGGERDHLRVVADQRGCPTDAGDLAGALAAITRRFVSGEVAGSGTWHCTNAGDTTWHGLAVHLFEVAGRLGAKVPGTIEAISTADYPTPARRPADSRLNCDKLARDFGIVLRPWQDAVAEIVGELVHR